MLIRVIRGSSSLHSITPLLLSFHRSRSRSRLFSLQPFPNSSFLIGAPQRAFPFLSITITITITITIIQLSAFNLQPFPKSSFLIGAIGATLCLSASLPLCHLASARFDTGKLAEIDAAVERTVEQGKIPGGVFWLEHDGEAYAKAYGHMSVEPEIIPARLGVIYDAASLTKVVATTPAILLLMERGRIELDAPVHRYLEDYTNGEGTNLTIRHLLTHTSGLPPGIPLSIEEEGVSKKWEGYETALALALAERPQTDPGTQFVYSDINFILLGEIIQRATGRPLESFTREEIFEPLRMVDTGFLPSLDLKSRIAPTNWVDGEMLRGAVHDPVCRRAGGALGHAGLFTTAADLARYARMILNKGELNGLRLLERETVEIMTSNQSPDQVDALRGLGWDIDSSYSGLRGSLFPVGGFGHTGFTGSSLWIDPYSNSFVIFMSNRTHPHGKGDVLELRGQLGTLAAEAISGFDFD